MGARGPGRHTESKCPELSFTELFSTSVPLISIYSGTREDCGQAYSKSCVVTSEQSQSLLEAVSRQQYGYWYAKRSSQSILKEINPEYSLEGLTLKLQYSGHLIRRFIRKDPNAEKDCSQEKKGMTED